MKNNNNGSIIIASLVAAAAGVAIGMLLAPDTGENLRKSLKEKLSDFMSAAEKQKANGTHSKHVSSDLEA